MTTHNLNKDIIAVEVMISSKPSKKFLKVGRTSSHIFNRFTLSKRVILLNSKVLSVIWFVKTFMRTVWQLNISSVFHTEISLQTFVTKSAVQKGSPRMNVNTCHRIYSPNNGIDPIKVKSSSLWKSSACFYSFVS